MRPHRLESRMREIRPSGSEGGVKFNPSSLPLCAPASAWSRRSESLLQAGRNRLVTESNCVVVRRGGEQLEVNDLSVVKALQGQRTRYGLMRLASLLVNGEACRGESRVLRGRRARGTLRKTVRKRCGELIGWVETERIEGDTREAGRPARAKNGVHARWEPKSRPCRSQSVGSSGEAGNDRGAKRRRKVEA